MKEKSMTAVWHDGPATAKRKRRAVLVYIATIVVGLLPWALDLAPGVKAAGLGLLAPGFGFLAVGGWALLLLPVCIFLFLAALFAWFGAGGVIFPIIIWLGSAALAGSMMGPVVPDAKTPLFAVALLIVGAAATAISSRKTTQRALAQRRVRKETLPIALASAHQAATVAFPVEDSRELDDGQLASAAYLLDRALQPVPEFAGFDDIDIFQTASLRYQINYLGYSLGVMQRCYMPAFRGYASQAQINLIEKIRLRRVWNYWIYESLWGRFSTDFDPANIDNIMLTGYYGAQVAIHAKINGDDRYLQPGSLTFQLSKRTAYAHDLHSIIGSIVRNIDASEFGLYPCEPNWIYPVCNFRAMGSLTAYDSLFGTDHVSKRVERWKARLRTDFTDPSGKIIGIRSSLTGLRFPFPSSDLDFAAMANSFDPHLAERLWALGRYELLPLLAKQDGLSVIAFPNIGIDLFNYHLGARTLVMAGVMHAAREMGDEEIATAAQNTLDIHGQRQESHGVLSYADGSNGANIFIAQARIMGRGDNRLTFSGSAPASATEGPLLDHVDYAKLRVARAFNDATSLDFVLVPVGNERRPSKIEFCRLVAGQEYTLVGTDERLRADSAGRGHVRMTIESRTRLRLNPLI